MTTTSNGYRNNWLTPTLFSTLLIAAIAGGGYMIQQASAAIRDRHEADIGAVYQVLSTRSAAVDQRLKEIREDLKDLKKIILENR